MNSVEGESLSTANHPWRIRRARTDDARAVARIYAPYVERTAITFDETAPAEEDFARKIASTERVHPFLVAEDDSGAVVGYAYASAFKERAAYVHSVEVSVYCDMASRGRGLGSALYAALEGVLRIQGVYNANACITAPAGPDDRVDDASLRFHTSRGYRMVGTFHSCGYKFNRWYDVAWMEKMLGEHPGVPAPFRPMSSLGADEVDEAISHSR